MRFDRARRRTISSDPFQPPAKLDFVGIALRRGITLHGFALNVAPKLSYDDRIHSCGLNRVEIVSLSSLLRKSIPMQEVKMRTVEFFEDVFDLKTGQVSLSLLLATLSSFSPSS